MSWLLGNSGTSFWTDATSLFHNATTGELTPEQQSEIATSATKELTACSGDPSTWSPGCILQDQGNIDTITKLQPPSGCVLNIPGLGLPCFKSWGSVLFGAIALAFGFLALYGIVVNYPTVVALRRK